jgi:hypothetical protein
MIANDVAQDDPDNPARRTMSVLFGAEPTPRKSRTDGFRLLVTGGRQFAGKNFTFRALDLLHAELQLGWIIEGGAVDAYSLSNEWAHRNDVHMQTCPLLVSSKLQGKRAGHERNAYMLEHYKPQAVLVFPGGRGTLNMESLAAAAGIPVASATKLLADPPAVIAALKGAALLGAASAT